MTVLVCRGEIGLHPASPVEYDAIPADIRSGPLGPILDAIRNGPVHLVGPRPKKAIDPLLSGRVLVVGDDADLNAVALRLLRNEMLGSVEVAYAPAAPTAFTELHGLPVGVDAATAAKAGSAEPVPLVRNDSGGVLVGLAEITAVTGTFYVDARRVPGGKPALIHVHPDADQGVTVTVTRRGPLGIGRRAENYTGRAVEFGIVAGGGTTITFDGIRHPRDTNRWVFYRHIEPLRIVRP